MRARAAACWAAAWSLNLRCAGVGIAGGALDALGLGTLGGFGLGVGLQRHSSRAVHQAPAKAAATTAVAAGVEALDHGSPHTSCTPSCVPALVMVVERGSLSCRARGC